MHKSRLAVEFGATLIAFHTFGLILASFHHHNCGAKWASVNDTGMTFVIAFHIYMCDNAELDHTKADHVTEDQFHLPLLLHRSYCSTH